MSFERRVLYSHDEDVNYAVCAVLRL